jgi:ubiquinone/menaquinone biosynthesis C-methylase UbiE
MGLGHLLHGHQQPTTRGATIGLARTYELLSVVVFAGRRRRIFGRLVSLSGARPGDRILDVGCGPGYLTRLSADAVAPGGTAVGLDASPNAITYAQRLTQQDNCSFQVGLAESLDAPDGSFDVVVSSLAIHHLPEDLRPQALQEMFRVLRPGGRLLIADYRPPTSKIGKHLIGAVAGPAMQHNPIHLLATLTKDAGFDQLQQGDVGSWLHYVQGVRP